MFIRIQDIDVDISAAFARYKQGMEAEIQMFSDLQVSTMFYGMHNIYCTLWKQSCYWLS